jgi:hypothetical protein
VGLRKGIYEAERLTSSNFYALYQKGEERLKLGMSCR